MGHIFWQPGGPGEPGSQHITLIESGKFYVGPDLLDHFDIVGIDIRGTGLSSPINCDAEIFNKRMPWPIETQEQLDEVAQTNHAFRQSCLEKSSVRNLIDYMDSISIAHDYEAVRLILGGDKMNWLGVSYGTMLGSIYAELFPNNIRSMSLDGVIAAPTERIPYFIESASGMEVVFRKALEWCPLHPADPSCPEGVNYNSMNKSVTELWEDILQAADRKPLACVDPAFCVLPDMTSSEIQYAASQLLYLYADWGQVTARILNATARGDATPFVQDLPQAFNTADPLSKQGYTNGYKFSNRAVVCQDMPHDYHAADLRILNSVTRVFSPLTGKSTPAGTFQLNCVGWSGGGRNDNARNSPHTVQIPRTENLPTILMSQLYYDPATPLSVGQRLRENIGTDRVVSVFAPGGGHGVYQQNNANVSANVAAINAYVLNLTLPADGKVFDS